VNWKSSFFLRAFPWIVIPLNQQGSLRSSSNAFYCKSHCSRNRKVIQNIAPTKMTVILYKDVVTNKETAHFVFRRFCLKKVQNRDDVCEKVVFSIRRFQRVCSKRKLHRIHVLFISPNEFKRVCKSCQTYLQRIYGIKNVNCINYLQQISIKVA